ncbi:hypothetical protein PV08_02959 [Exophiala spinifera]|uniref:Uncharacterized protein n=1 Tax=Exophiala spinifera TaxID=91928 RepID=A0A0D2BJA6_9EURO|nr:uncharacterized protein PV08_02959 [Exophiala spinifera]KIW18670.1 hypothetical protein PV08_02959 [Exophiala spinifera]
MSNPIPRDETVDLLGVGMIHGASHVDNTPENVQDPLKDELDNLSRAVSLTAAVSPQKKGTRKKYIPVPRPDFAEEPWHGVSMVLKQSEHNAKRRHGKPGRQ